MDKITEKQCIKCAAVKKLNEFHKKKTAKDGHINVCKSCKKAQDKAYREANKAVLAAKFKAKYHANKEKLQARSRNQYANATAEQVLQRKEKKRKYNKQAPEEVKQRKREYNKKYFASEAGKLTTAKSVHKRRAQKIATEDGTVTSQALETLKDIQQRKCKYCECTLDFSAKGKVHLDHVVPLSKGGTHTITNVVWSCSSCNLRKSNKLTDV